MRVTGLHVHPVKSTAIRAVAVAAVSPRGLAADRSWMLVDADGRMVSAREVHGLFRIVADTPDTDPTLGSDLRLRAPGVEELLLSEPAGDPVPVRLHRTDLTGVPAGPEADAWVRAVLDRDLRLVWCDDPTRRRLNPAHTRPGDHTAYADGYPVTIATEASLGRLNEWVAQTAAERGEPAPAPLPMARFRPNIVLDGDLPFAEDAWVAVTIGGVRLRVAKPTDRCVMTTIDPIGLASGKEPIRSLARHRLVEHKALFAVSLVPEGTGTIRVGDPVAVETSAG